MQSYNVMFEHANYYYVPGGFVVLSSLSDNYKRFIFPNHRVPEQVFKNACKSNPQLITKVNNFYRMMESVRYNGDDFVAIRPEWTTVDQILASR